MRAAATRCPLLTALSLDGKSVVFTSSASDLIENDLNGQPDLFVLRIADLSNDVDNDGLPDAWERVYFTDLSHSAAEDADRDGSPNVAEFEAGDKSRGSRLGIEDFRAGPTAW